MIRFKGVSLTNHLERTFIRISLDGTQAFRTVTEDDLEEELAVDFLDMYPFNLERTLIPFGNKLRVGGTP